MCDLFFYIVLKTHIKFSAQLAHNDRQRHRTQHQHTEDIAMQHDFEIKGSFLDAIDKLSLLKSSVLLSIDCV